MAEECKIDADYIHMDKARPGSGTSSFRAPAGLDDPNLSQEEKDLRLAIALQQQENASAQASKHSKIKQEQKSNMFRTGRSGAATGLAAMRARDGGMLRVPPEYNNEHAYKSGTRSAGNYSAPAPGASDAEYAAHLQHVEMEAAKIGMEASRVLRKEAEIDAARKHRVERSGVPTRPGAIKK